MSRDRILSAALPLFAERGFEGVTLRAIGAGAGLHNSSLFHHFGGKHEIAHGVLERAAEGVLPRLAPLAADDPPRLDTLVDVACDLADHFAAAPHEGLVLLRVLAGPPRTAWAPAARGGGRSRAAYPAVVVRLFTRLWSWLERAADAGAIRPVRVQQAARSLLGALLFEATAAGGERDAGDPAQRRRRRAELAAFVRGAFAPREAA